MLVPMHTLLCTPYIVCQPLLLSQITFSVSLPSPPLTHLLCLFHSLLQVQCSPPCSVLRLLCPCQDKSHPNTA